MWGSALVDCCVPAWVLLCSSGPSLPGCLASGHPVAYYSGTVLCLPRGRATQLSERSAESLEPWGKGAGEAVPSAGPEATPHSPGDPGTLAPLLLSLGAPGSRRESPLRAN